MNTNATRSFFAFVSRNRVWVVGLTIFLLLASYGCRKTGKFPVPGKPADPGQPVSPSAPGSVDSSIVYTDLVPDSIIFARLLTIYGNVGRHYELDLDRDGISDFEFLAEVSQRRGEESTVGYAGVRINPYSSTSGDAIAIDTGHIELFGSLAAIGVAGQSWSSSSISVSDPKVKWNRDTTCFGLKLVKNNNTYYGWVKVSNLSVHAAGHMTTPSASITIMEYAYDSIPNRGILAGQK